jgi:dTDP-4-amino-4,6-dideoxygalactose transaminase
MNLAINGGIPVRDKEDYFPAQETIGDEEQKAVSKVIQTGILSHYRGNYIPAFYGGPQIKLFERLWSERFHSEYCIAVNSCTSALQIACGAAGIEPGDEVIVTPYSMSCSATAPMVWGGIPIFADIEPEYFCLDVDDVKRKITKKTKAIIAVDLFGLPINPKLRQLADEHKLILIEDAAQAPGAMVGRSFTGNIGHMGCFSFTQGKHMTAGEGGLITTNDARLARRCQLIRNHAESVISASEGSTENWFNWNNMLGFNLRMTEIQAAIMIEQMQKLDKFILTRRNNAKLLTGELEEIPAIRVPGTRPDCTHSYYVLPFLFNEGDLAPGLSRDTFLDAVRAELNYEDKRIDRGIPIGGGYITPLYKMPLFQNRQHWAIRDTDYSKLYLPVVEDLWRRGLGLTLYHGLPLTDRDICDIGLAFAKCWEHQDEIPRRSV